MTKPLVAHVPVGPVPLAEVAELYPTVRQSLLSGFDDCALSTLFSLRYGQQWSTHPQARGTLMHRFIAECLRTMKAENERTIPPTVAFEILYETLRQRDVPPEEIVRVPLRSIREMRAFAYKWAKDNEFDVDAIIDIEKTLTWPITYEHPETGELVERRLTGQLDALIAEPPKGAIVIDWKDTWGLPPDHSDSEEEEDPDGLSYHGYFQQRFYAWLVMRNFPAVQRVTLREFYIRKSEPRSATVTRDRLHHIEQELSILVEHFDRAVASGPPPRPLNTATTGPWTPSPGRHCGFCLKPGACPIEDEARGEGAITSQAMARDYAAEFTTATRVRSHRRDALKAWVDARGPVPIKSSKGRRVLGWVKNKTGGGRTFKVHAPAFEPAAPEDSRLEEAIRESSRRALAAKRKRITNGQ